MKIPDLTHMYITYNNMYLYHEYVSKSCLILKIFVIILRLTNELKA